MAKTAQVKPDRRKSAKTTPAAPIGDDVIARRAFEVFCGRGGEHGQDLQDWLQAERELRPAAEQTAG